MNQFTNKRRTNNRHWQTNMSQSLSLHRKTIKGVSTFLRRTQTDQADFEIAFDLLRQHQKHACIPGHLKPSSWKQNKGLIQAITFRKCLFLPTCTLTLIHGSSCFERVSWETYQRQARVIRSEQQGSRVTSKLRTLQLSAPCKRLRGNGPACICGHTLAHTWGIMYGGTVICIAGGEIPSLSLTQCFCMLFNYDVLLTACLQGI